MARCLMSLEPLVRASIEIDARYAVYLERQERDIRNYNKEQELKIPKAISVLRL